MKQPSREEYERAVALARAAIRARKRRPRNWADRSPQAVLAKMQAKQAKGEPLTEADLGAMAAALAEQDNRKRRGRGRPKGARHETAHGALWAAMYAVHASGLRPYRNAETGPRLSQCDAISDAMKAEGFIWLSSYDAARREMVALRKSLRGAGAALARHLQAIQRDISKALEPLGRQMQEMGRTFAALGKQTGARAILQPGTLPTLFAHLRAQTTLPPETQRAIERAMKTRR